MKISIGTKAEFEPCLLIATQLPQHFTKKALEQMTQDLQEQKFYIANEQNKVIGFISIIHKSTSVAELTWLAVHPDHQHQGIGTALALHIRSELIAQDFKLLLAKTLAEEANYPPYETTRKFYKRLGFIHIETVDPYPDWDEGNPCAIYVMIL